MGRVSLFIYLAVALLVVFLISYAPTKPSTKHRYRRLKLKSASKFDPTHHSPILFDPLVAEIVRHREDREWERQYIDHTHPDLANHDPAPAHESQPEWEDFMDAEDYLNDEQKFNISSRLMMLFPRIDTDADGYVTQKELTEWTLLQAEKEVIHRAQREMDTHDKNKDGLLSFSEYEPPSWARNSDNNSFGYDMGWWKEEHFNASDADEDGLLNVVEFNDFLHPADTKNPNLLQWLCKEEVRERDSDKDGKVNFKEFFHGLFDLVRNYDEENHNSSHPHENSSEIAAKHLFAQLDKDGDGFLSDVELLPVINKIHPSEHYYAKQQADYIISQADTDKDGTLTLGEMMDNPYVFYSAVFSDADDGDDDEDYSLHDEFR